MTDRHVDGLRARIDAALPPAIDERSLAAAARERLDALLDLVAAGRGIREAGSGLNAASAELLVVDALLTDAAARAARHGTPDEMLAVLNLDALAARARGIDHAARTIGEAARGDGEPGSAAARDGADA